MKQGRNIPRRGGLPGALALLALLLAGCAAVSPSYRDESVPITSIAAFDPARYAGRWHEVARYPVPFQARCTGPAVVDYAPRGDGTLSVVNTCPTAPGQVARVEGVARPAGPGRLAVRFQGVPVEGPYWVLWVEEGYRTAVVGVRSGRAGWILNRDPRIPADRLRAAREVLDWNGYDLSRLQMLP